MVGLIDSHRFLYGCAHRIPPVFVWLDYQRPSGVFVVGLLENTYVFAWLDSQGPPGIREVGLLNALWYFNGWTFRGPPVFLRLNS